MTVGLIVWMGKLSSGEGDFAASILVGAWLALTSAVGALICSRRPENSIGRILLSGGLLIALGLFATEYAQQALIDSRGSLPFGRETAWLSSWVALPGFYFLIFLLVLFPSGRLPSPHWRIPAWLAAVGGIAATVAIALRPGPIPAIGVIDNPLGLERAADLLHNLEQIAILPIALIGAGAVVSQVRRLRTAPAEERRQIKWFAFAAGTLLLAIVGNLVSDPLEGMPRELLGLVVPVLALLFIPIAIGIAVLKYDLYDIDVIVNRTLVYGVLTATLGVAYAGGVVLLQEVFSSFTGGDQLSVAGATLVVAALFRPARAWIQGFIDRRFYRVKYDSAQTLESFMATLRKEVELDALTSDLLNVVAQTVQPAHVSIWLRPPRQPAPRSGAWATTAPSRRS